MPPRDPDEGLRRFLEDYREWEERRSWEERRHGDRRLRDVPVARERRQSERRSGEERRIVLTDRRRPIADVYTPTEARQIGEMLLDHDTDVACPRCHGQLLAGPMSHRGATPTREVHCTTCRHRAVIAFPPEQTDRIADS